MSHGSAYTQNTFLVTNRLSEADSHFDDGIGTWVVTSGSATLSVDFDMKAYGAADDHNSLKVTPSGSGDVSISPSSVLTALSDSSDDIAFHARVKCDKAIVVTIVVSEGTGTLSSVTRQQTVPAGRWTVIRSSGIDIPPTSGSFNISVAVTFSGHEGESIYVGHPTVYADYQFTENGFLREVVTLIPEVIRVKDYEQSFPKYPFMRLAEIGCAYPGAVKRAHNHFRFLTLAEGRNANDIETLSGLVDPSAAEEEYLPWLSQLVGVKLLGASSGTTAWENFLGTWSEIMQAVSDDGFTTTSIASISRASSGYVTVTIDSGDWPTPAPQSGQTIIVSGTTSFNGQHEISSVNAGSYQLTYQDGTRFARIYRDGSGTATGTLKDDESVNIFADPPDWAQIGTQITISGTSALDGTFTITDVSEGAATISWNDSGAETTETDVGSGSYVVTETSVGYVAQVDSEWVDLELYDIAVSALTSFWRSQISKAYNGYKSGSIVSMEQAAQEFLRDTKTVDITRHYGGDPWRIHVKTLTAETPDGVTGLSADIVTNVLFSASPAGYVVSHECVESL